VKGRELHGYALAHAARRSGIVTWWAEGDDASRRVAASSAPLPDKHCRTVLAPSSPGRQKIAWCYRSCGVGADATPGSSPWQAAGVGQGGEHGGLLDGGLLGTPRGGRPRASGSRIARDRGRALPAGRGLHVVGPNEAGAPFCSHEPGRRSADPIRAARRFLPAPGRGWEVLLRNLPCGAAPSARLARLLSGCRPGGGQGRVQAPWRVAAEASWNVCRLPEAAALRWGRATRIGGIDQEP